MNHYEVIIQYSGQTLLLEYITKINMVLPLIVYTTNLYDANSTYVYSHLKNLTEEFDVRINVFNKIGNISRVVEFFDCKKKGIIDYHVGVIESHLTFTFGEKIETPYEKIPQYLKRKSRERKLKRLWKQ